MHYTFTFHSFLIFFTITICVVLYAHAEFSFQTLPSTFSSIRHLVVPCDYFKIASVSAALADFWKNYTFPPISFLSLILFKHHFLTFVSICLTLLCLVPLLLNQSPSVPFFPAALPSAIKRARLSTHFNNHIYFFTPFDCSLNSHSPLSRKPYRKKGKRR